MKLGLIFYTIQKRCALVSDYKSRLTSDSSEWFCIPLQFHGSSFCLVIEYPQNGDSTGDINGVVNQLPWLVPKCGGYQCKSQSMSKAVK